MTSPLDSSAALPNAAEVEARRLEALAEAQADEYFGGDLDARYSPGSLGHHELLHMAHVIEKLAEEHLLDHYACIRDPDLYAAADRIVSGLAAFYQAVGRQD